MGSKTEISWTDSTWNPIIGCSRVSEGCRNCYAETIAGRFGRGKPTVYSGLTQIVNGRSVWTGEIKETRQLLQPLSWRKARRIFVNSMSDLFHENVTDATLCSIFKVMCEAKRHTFQVLTKRTERMLDFISKWDPKTRDFGPLWPNTWPQRHIWLGVSVENQKAADERIPLLLQTPAAVRFISAEPLLGPVDINAYLRRKLAGDPPQWKRGLGLDWVICGGESGPRARPMHPDWARSLRDQCQAAGVPYFLKQWGEWKPIDSPINNPKDVVRGRRQCVKQDGQHCNTVIIDGVPEGSQWMECLGKRAAGALLDGVEHREFPATEKP